MTTFLVCRWRKKEKISEEQKLKTYNILKCHKWLKTKYVVLQENIIFPQAWQGANFFPVTNTAVGHLNYYLCNVLIFSFILRILTNGELMKVRLWGWH